MKGRRVARSTALATLLVSLLAILGAASGAEAPITDPVWPYEWWFDTHDISVASEAPTGDGVVVAVIDSGVWLDHPDLAGQLVPGITFVGTFNDRCLEGCGHGGWEEAQQADTASAHGTEMAGLIGAQLGNGIGMVGVAPGVKIMPIRVSADDGGIGLDDPGYAIVWAVDHGADVISMSFGMVDGYELVEPAQNPSFREAIVYAQERGVALVAGAGNEFAWPFCKFPAQVAGVLCVTAVDKRGHPIPESTSPGFRIEPGAVVAGPADSVAYTVVDRRVENRPTCDEIMWSLAPQPLEGWYQTQTDAAACGLPSDGSLDETGGTSAATAVMSGLVARLMSMGCTAEAAVDALVTTAKPGPLDTGTGWSPYYGAGMASAASAEAHASSSCRDSAG